MQLIEVPAKTGYVWFRQGIWLFRKNPLAFLTLFFTYLLVMTLVSQIPVIGGVPAAGVHSGRRRRLHGRVPQHHLGQAGVPDHSGGRLSLVRPRWSRGGCWCWARSISSRWGLVLAGSALADGGMLLKVMLGMAAVRWIRMRSPTAIFRSR